MQSEGRIMQSEGRIMQSFRADSAICETFFLANIQIVESAPQIAESAPDCRIRPSRKKPLWLQSLLALFPIPTRRVESCN